MEQEPQEEGDAFDSKKLEELINDVRTGVKDSVHIHDFVRHALSSQRREIGEKVEKLVEKWALKEEQAHGFQPYGYTDEKKEEEIYFAGFKDGRAMMAIDLTAGLKGGFKDELRSLLNEKRDELEHQSPHNE